MTNGTHSEDICNSTVYFVDWEGQLVSNRHARRSGHDHNIHLVLPLLVIQTSKDNALQLLEERGRALLLNENRFSTRYAPTTRLDPKRTLAYLHARQSSSVTVAIFAALERITLALDELRFSQPLAQSTRTTRPSRPP